MCAVSELNIVVCLALRHMQRWTERDRKYLFICIVHMNGVGGGQLVCKGIIACCCSDLLINDLSTMIRVNQILHKLFPKLNELFVFQRIVIACSHSFFFELYCPFFVSLWLSVSFTLRIPAFY